MFVIGLSLLLLGGALFFVMSGRHLLNSLIMLEFLVLVIFMLLVSCLSLMSSSYIILFMFFVLTVSSAALGLSLLICLCRTHGKDYLSSYNVLW